ncbi:hypothetical protein OG225_25165 [Nocardia sp. NBC_01377]|uniref:hypothetical protein n=1 Tax=Nocardia sp. NBC_01377 TaxID=2903595 RepID=UPI00324AEE36
MVKEATVPEDSSDPVSPVGDYPSPLLGTSERVLATILGVIVAAAGTVGVFVSDNQAGTAALFILAAALLLMGVQGTPLTRFGSGEHSIEFVRRRLGRELIQQGRLEQSGEAARAYIDAVAIVAPNLLNSVSGRALVWEAKLSEALTRIIGARPRHREEGNDHVAFSFGLQHAGELLGFWAIDVVALYRDRGVSTAEVASMAARRKPVVVPALIVANDASIDVLARIGEWQDNVRVVIWSGVRDDERLRDAIDALNPRT